VIGRSGRLNIEYCASEGNIMEPGWKEGPEVLSMKKGMQRSPLEC